MPRDGSLPTAAETLRRAASILRERGHAQGTFYQSDTGAVCAMSAIQLAKGAGTGPLYPMEEPPAPYPEFLKFVGLRPHMWSDLCGWNNKPGRTGEEIAQKFEACADAMEASDAA